MNDDSVQQTEDQPQARRGRPPKAKTRRKFAAELLALEGRVALGVKMLNQALELLEANDPHVAKRIIAITIETLTERD